MSKWIVVLVFLVCIVSCKLGGGSESSVQPEASISTSCPNNYILVPGNSTLATSDFCVMKYEAKAWLDNNSNEIVDSGEVDSDGCNEAGCTTSNWGTSNHLAISSSEGLPWRRIDRITAKTLCTTLGPNYDLISNVEWLTIAREIELDARNWSSSIVSDGIGSTNRIFGGNTGAASSYDYNNGGLDSGAGRDTKARLYLSNDNEIWDISGNAWEWVDWTFGSTLGDYPGSCGTSWWEVTSSGLQTNCADLSLEDAYPKRFPSIVLSSDDGIGKVYGGNLGGAMRGGGSTSSTNAGVYSLHLNFDNTTSSDGIGFRCVYRE